MIQLKCLTLETFLTATVRKLHHSSWVLLAQIGKGQTCFTLPPRSHHPIQVQWENVLVTKGWLTTAMSAGAHAWEQVRYVEGEGIRVSVRGKEEEAAGKHTDKG